jgi:hypothetical protein
MKTNTCYFCNPTLKECSPCQACQDKYNLDYVYTRYIDTEHNGDLKLYFSEIGLNINGIYYYVRLRFLDYTYAPINETRIYVNHKLILTLPGYPFTPANIKDKLKLYLLFSWKLKLAISVIQF